jgi:hypothetical protein
MGNKNKFYAFIALTWTACKVSGLATHTNLVKRMNDRAGVVK